MTLVSKKVAVVFWLNNAAYQYPAEVKRIMRQVGELLTTVIADLSKPENVDSDGVYLGMRGDYLVDSHNNAVGTVQLRFEELDS